MKLKRWISLMVTLCLMCSSLQILTVSAYEVAGEDDEEINCYCSFDMEIDNSFKDYPIYQFAEDGILHVSAYRSQSGTYFEFGAKDKFAVEAHKRILGNRSWQKGEWMILPAWTEGVKWDSVDFIDEDSDNTKLIMRNVRRFCPDNPLKAARSSIYLAVDMIESANGMTIQMYLYNGEEVWDMNDWDSGEVKHLSSTADYIPSSFDEIRLTQYGRPRSRSLFRQKGGVWEGDASSNDKEEDKNKDTTEDKDEAEDKDKTDNTTPKDVEKDNPKPSAKPDEEDKKTERGINQGENVPKIFHGLTKEESIEKYSAYYDENGIEHNYVVYNGLANYGKDSYKATLESKVEMTVPQNVSGISSDGVTTFTIYDIKQDVRKINKKPATRWRTILKAEGNLGSQLYEMGNHAWRISPGTTVSAFPGLDANTSYFGWCKVDEITDRYIISSDHSEVGNIKIHYQDDARTGIGSIEFEFGNMHMEIPYERLDYIGPFFEFFMSGALSDDWKEYAKQMGLTAKEEQRNNTEVME